MSILGTNSSEKTNMDTPLFHEFKKQASFFFKEKIKTARLALTDVTPAQLLTEEVTGGNSRAPDTRSMRLISRAAFEVDDYWRIVEILHKRLSKFDRKNWRISYNSLILLEHLLTHGPKSASEEFQIDKDVIKEIGTFQHIDEKGFNWGLVVRKKSERILKLLEKGPLLNEERNRARSVTRGIQGFGSFSARSSSVPEFQRESSFQTYGRCNSQFNDHEHEEDQNSSSNNEEGSTKTGFAEKQKIDEDLALVSGLPMEKSTSSISFDDAQKLEILYNTQSSLKENMAPYKKVVTGKLHGWNGTGESKSLLGGTNEQKRIEISAEEDHPFNDTECQSTTSLLSTRG